MRFFAGDADRVAVILPGATYSPDRSLLHFIAKELVDDGWTVNQVWWQRGAVTTMPEAASQAGTALETMGRARHRLIVGWGLGTSAWPQAVTHSLPAVWLAPRLGERTVRESAAITVEPTLVVGGTGDPQWNRAAAEAGRAQVYEMADADHSLELPGSARETMKRQEAVVARVWDFVEGLRR